MNYAKQIRDYTLRSILYTLFSLFATVDLLPHAQETDTKIIDVYVNGLSRSTATINWKTTNPVISQVAFGTTTLYGDTVAANADPDTVFQVNLDSLEALTTYHYQIFIEDSSGQIHSGVDRQFRTTATNLLYFNNITNDAGTTGPTQYKKTGGHSVCFTDVDGDSLPDLYITMAYLEPQPDLFFRNRNGTNFSEEAAKRGIADFDGGSHGAVFFDADNDGDYDLYNGTTDASKEDSGRNRLYLNDGNGYFTDVSDSVGLPDIHWETRAVTALDYDRDGDLDIMTVTGYLGNDDPASDNNEFYHNNLMETGELRFVPIDSSYFNVAFAGQGIIDTDWDGDGDVDLIAANRTGEVHFIRNENNAFRAISPQSLGLTVADSAKDGITTADIDNDGDLDLLLAGDDYGIVYKRMLTGHYIFSQRFDDTDGYMGDFADLDNDTDLDLVFAGDTVAYLNNGNGFFIPGPVIPIDNIEDPRAIGFADIDLDGDVDFAYACKRSRNQLFRNKLNSGSWLKVNLKSRYGQAGAKGSKVMLFTSDATRKMIGHREVRSINGYLGQNEPVLHFGLATYEFVDVIVVFPDGSIATRKSVPKNSIISINGPDTDTAAPLISKINTPEIEQTTAILKFVTNEASFITLNYGASGTSLTNQLLQPNQARLHEFQLTNLVAGTTYEFRIEARDASSNIATKSGIFNTLGPIPLYGLFEMTVTVPNTATSFYTNPPNIIFQFTGISGEALNQDKTISAFWDGDSTFRVRFIPEKTGDWQWQIISDEATLNGWKDTFVCRTNLPENHSLRHGFVRVSETNPYTFQYENGTPYFLLGDTQWSFSTDAIHDVNFQHYVNVRSEQGFNYIHGVAYQIFPEGNDKNSGGQAFINNHPDSLNPGFWQEFDKRIAYLNEKGIVAGILLAWGDDAWQNFQTKEQVARFTEYIVHRYSAYNVFWIVAGEFEEAAVVGGYEHIAQSIANADPYMHPITTHTIHSSADSADALEWQSFIYQQTPHPEQITTDRVHKKPVVNSEFGYEERQPADSVRLDAWKIVMRGGYAVYGNANTYHYFARMTDENLYSAGAKYMQNIGIFFAKAHQKNVNWWEITRFDSINSDSYQAIIDQNKLFYYSENKTSFHLPLPDSDRYWLHKAWFNTRTGEWFEMDSVVIDTTQHIIPPDSAFAGFFLLVNVADTAVSDEDNLLQNFTLSQNYPNPFGKLTQWQINVPQPGRLSIRIFDTRGRLTRSILSEEVDSGLLNIDWDGTNNSGQHVANGVYIIEAKYNTATGENKSLTKRLVYLK